jgi:hypothetical protein
MASPRLFYAAMMRPERVLSKPSIVSGQHRWRDAESQTSRAVGAQEDRGFKTLNGFVVRPVSALRGSAALLPATLLFTLAAGGVSAGTVAETASRWGLIGRWSIDCRIAPDHDRGAVLSYQVVGRSKVVLHRDFGDSEDQADVIAAQISGDNLLDLRIYFPLLKQTRELGLRRLPDGGIRAIYNRTRNGAYSIMDGRITASGEPTPPQFRCGQ